MMDTTQKFLYETDCLSDFEKVLTVAVRIMFHEESNKYHQMYITSNDYRFDDGKTWVNKECEPGDPKG